MKLKYLFIIVLAMVLYQCQVHKTMFQKEPLFSFTTVFSQNIIGGQPDNAYIKLTIELEGKTMLVPDSLYYQGRISSVTTYDNNGKKQWVGSFKTTRRKQVNLHHSPMGDVVEEVPKASNFPFELTDNEAVLRYRDTSAKKIYYFKFKDIEVKEPVFMAMQP